MQKAEGLEPAWIDGSDRHGVTVTLFCLFSSNSLYGEDWKIFGWILDSLVHLLQIEMMCNFVTDWKIKVTNRKLWMKLMIRHDKFQNPSSNHIMLPGHHVLLVNPQIGKSSASLFLNPCMVRVLLHR